MQITCPRCTRVYDVPVEALPAPGRDVQCSGCGHGWYQLSTGDAPEPVASETAPGPGPTPAMEPPPRRDVDPEILRILREEAAYEAARRSGETVGAPGPGDASRGDVAPGTQASAEQSSDQDHGAETADPNAGGKGANAGAPASARRSVARQRNLPVALSAAEQREAAQARHRRGFRAGFAATAGICGVAITLYLFAPQIARISPGTTPLLDTMVAEGDRLQARIVDAARAFAE